MLDQRGIQPEHLPAEEDLKKLSKQTPGLPKDERDS
jgi:DNA-damage-inducible protein D